MKNTTSFEEELNEINKRLLYSIQQIRSAFNLNLISLSEVLLFKYEHLISLDKNALDYEISEQLVAALNKKFGVNQEWIKSNNGIPFVYSSYHNASGIKKEIENKKSNIEQIYIIYSEEDHYGEAQPSFNIALKFEDYGFFVNDKSWHINDNVGRGGQMQITSLYNFITLLNTSKLDSKVSSFELDSSDFKELKLREKHPLLLINSANKTKKTGWHNAFFDIHTESYSANHYKNKYGNWLVEAQKIVLFIQSLQKDSWQYN